MATNTVGYMFGNLPDTRTKESDELLVDSDTYIGIELELEGTQHLQFYKKFLTDNNWKWVVDHSLRGSSCELITSSLEGSPIRGMDIVTALEALNIAVAKCKDTYGTYPDANERCSTHVHVDIRDLNSAQASRFILYYVMFEEILMKSEAPRRCDNNYCLPVSKSGDLKTALVDLLKTRFDSSQLQHVITEWPKYCALNVGSASKLGTVEFRIFPGSYDPKQILMWVNIILSLRRAAVNNTLDVIKIPQTVSGQGLDKVLESVFPKEIADHLIKSVEPRDVLKGARLIQSLIARPYCSHPQHRTPKGDEPSNNFKAFQAMQGVK